MLAYTLVALAAVSSVFAAPTPNGADPTSPALGECKITWTADTDTAKPWKTMNIEFMTGSNQQMTHMRTIATVDATTTTSFTWVCPQVDLYAPVYFYQFSSPVDPAALAWVTRFTITDTDGSSVPAPETDSGGIPWGVGHFVDSSLYNAMPAYLNGNGQLQGAPGNGTTTSSTSSGAPASSPSATGSTTSAGSTGTSAGSTKPTGTGSSTIATVTKGTSTGTSSPSSTSTSTTGGASALSSPSLMALFGALMAGAAALSF